MNNRFNRFIRDVQYDLLVSPFGYDYYHMTAKQAAGNFEWFLSVIPQRMEYLKNRCALDLRIPIEKLDFSAASLIPIWRWFLKTARIEKTPKEELIKMEEGAKVFGESFINLEQFTVATQFIMKDIGMYIGQSYVLNYPKLHWHYYTKPKNEINAKQPIIAGFYYKDQYDAIVNPMNFVDGAAANIYDKTQKETDIYDFYMQWVQWIPE